MSDRAWPLPKRKHSMRMGWHDLLFAHWPVDLSLLRTMIPESLTIDTFDGQAWIGLVPFRMTDVSPRCLPAIPGLSAFPELNVRTYVTNDGKPGVWFFSLDATQKIAVRVARKFFHLPYMDADISIRLNSGWFDYSCTRTHCNEPAAELDMHYRPIGPEIRPGSGSLEHWMTARYCLYSADAKGQLYRGEIDHDPWPLQFAEAKWNANSMFGFLESELHGQPHLLFSRSLSVRAWSLDKVSAKAI